MHFAVCALVLLESQVVRVVNLTQLWWEELQQSQLWSLLHLVIITIFGLDIY